MTDINLVTYHIGGSVNAHDAGILASAAYLDGATIDLAGRKRLNMSDLFCSGTARISMVSWTREDRMRTLEAVLKSLRLNFVRHVRPMDMKSRTPVTSTSWRTSFRGENIRYPVEITGPASHEGAPLFSGDDVIAFLRRPAVTADACRFEIQARNPHSLPHFQINDTQAAYDELMRLKVRHYAEEAQEALRVHLTEPVMIWSGVHRAYWRQDGAGYAQSPEGAGTWPRGEAEERIRTCGPEKMVSLREASLERGQIIEQQRAAMIAGLRLLQERGQETRLSDFAHKGGHLKLLEADEIDELCHALGTAQRGAVVYLTTTVSHEETASVISGLRLLSEQTDLPARIKGIATNLGEFDRIGRDALDGLVSYLAQHLDRLPPVTKPAAVNPAASPAP